MKKTVNADKRYYIDEGLLVNPGSFLKTLEVFNNAKICLYNLLYDKEYGRADPFAKRSYVSILKEKFHIDDYYCGAIYKEAAACLSSQKELRKLYLKTTAAEIDTRQRKLDDTLDQLEKKQAVKASIKTYAKTRKWIKPYPKCRLKVSGQTISGDGIKPTPIEEYEIRVEESIRSLKNRAKMVAHGLKRKQQKLHYLETLPPRRIVFGTRKMYAAKDAEDADRAAWKEAFRFKRHSTMELPGRRDSKYGNFQCRFIGGDLHVTCTDGQEAVFKDFMPALFEDTFFEAFQKSKADRRAMAYSFRLCKDRDGRLYVIPSVILDMEAECSSDYSEGCVGADINWDRIDLTEIGKNGERLDAKTIRISLEGKTTGQITNEIGRAMKEVQEYCLERQKNLVMEDIDLVIKRHTMQYSSPTGNRHISLFAYWKIMECAKNQSLKTGLGIRFVDPAYTSQAGKHLFMRRFGISIHSAASYAIGLVGLSIYGKLMPDIRIQKLMKDEPYLPVPGDYKKAWRKVTNAFKGIQTHQFYGRLHYQEIKEKPRATIKTLANTMKQPSFT